MENVLLFDTYSNRLNLYPFTDTRTIASLRVGITTIMEKWQDLWQDHAVAFSTITEPYLATKFPSIVAERNLCVNASFLPTPNAIQAISNLAPGQCLLYREKLLAFRPQHPRELTIDFCSKYAVQGNATEYAAEELIQRIG